jgi:HEAT repeat protein
VKPLLELLKDSSKYCRENAVQALKRITGQNFSEDYEKWQQWHEKNRDK